MTPERQIRILKSALDTIQFEAKEPIIRVYAQSALDETKEPISVTANNHCKKHNWFGLIGEDCPLCNKSKNI